jgi:hypothetical protein
MKISKAEVKDILNATFPEYSGRKFRVEARQSIWIDRIGGGGSQDIPKLAGMDGTGKWAAYIPTVPTMQAPCGTFPIPLTAVVAVHSYFCGKDAGVTFYYHPEGQWSLLGGRRAIAAMEVEA